MPDGVEIKIFGDKDVIRQLEHLGNTAARRVVRRALNLGSKPILDAARQNCPIGPIDGGTLKRSLGRKMRTYRRNGSVFIAVGPRTGFKRQVGTDRNGKAIYRNPTKYAHLVEFGHGGPAPAPAHPFLRPAYDTKKSVAVSITEAEVIRGIENEASKR